MKVDHLENLSFPVGLLAHDYLNGIAEVVKEVFTRSRVDGAKKDKLSYWQLIFLQSKANGCSYRGESLPHEWRQPEQIGRHRLTLTRRNSLAIIHLPPIRQEYRDIFRRAGSAAARGVAPFFKIV